MHQIAKIEVDTYDVKLFIIIPWRRSTFDIACKDGDALVGVYCYVEPSLAGMLTLSARCNINR